jgi:hypothetical protein
MKSTLYEKVRYVVERLFFHGKKFVEDTTEVFKNRIDTAEEAKELLKTSAKVIDLIEIENAVKGVHFRNGKVNAYMPSDEYTLNDEYGFKLYNFNGQKNSFISDEELLKISKVINSIDNKPNYVFAMRVGEKNQYYFKIKEGKNGCGDFVDDDMKNVVKYLDSMKEAGATWRTITDLNNDIVDDISSWAITFTVS